MTTEQRRESTGNGLFLWLVFAIVTATLLLMTAVPLTAMLRQ
jgi:hypothetical protein